MTNIPNADGRDFWSGPSGLSWIASQEELDTIMADIASAVMETAAPNAGDKVIDIGCGTGALSLLAANAVGADGHVLATDISEPLLLHAGERGQTVPQMSTLLADAQIADWPTTDFDLAISRFGVMFFNDPPAAFANIARALKPGGRIAFAAWAPAQDNPFWELPARAAAARLGRPPKPEPNSPGPLGLADINLAQARLEAGGLINVGGREIIVFLNHPGGASAMASLCVRIGAARRVINHFHGTPEDAAAIEATLTDSFAPFETNGAVTLPARINLLTASRPA